MTRRHAAWGILLVWLAAVGWLVRREYLTPHRAVSANRALLVSPSAQYFRVMAGDRQVGFTSTTVDTTPGGFRTDPRGRVVPVPAEVRVQGVFVTEQPIGGAIRHTELRTFVRLSRLLQVQSFSARIRNDVGQSTVFGMMADDTTLLIGVSGVDSLHRIAVAFHRPLLLSTLMPLRLVFGRDLAPGKAYDMQVLDPLRLEVRDVHLAIQAESTFFVPDSAARDSAAHVWRPARTDTVQAWKVAVSSGSRRSDLWIDELGQVVREVDHAGFTLERQAFELAFENFRKRDTLVELTERPTIVPAELMDLKGASRHAVRSLLVRVAGLPAPDLAGGLQSAHADTLSIVRADSAALAAPYTLPNTNPSLQDDLGSTLLIQKDDPRVRAAAGQAIRGTRDPRLAAERIAAWMSAHLKDTVDLTPPFAARVLAAKRGDASQLAELYVALARAVGLPAHPVAGLVYRGGRFYVHAWAEVYLDGWVPVDPSLHQFPADASHIRLVAHRLARPLELTPLISGATLTVLGVDAER